MKETTIIIGAGIAGLTLAHRLGLNGIPSIVLEKAPVVGGLARSFVYDGFTFDIGPHRFHTEDRGVLAYVQDILDGEYLTIDRRSAVRMFGSDIAWPLTMKALARMPLKTLVSVGLDMIRTAAPLADDFKSYIISKYGPTLYGIFFEPYTRKFLHRPCEQISSDWARTGIERAVIDPRFKAGSASELARSMLRILPPLQFIYPSGGGIGIFCEKLSAKARQAGATILLNAPVDRIGASSDSIREVQAGGKTYPCGRLIWTGPVTELARLLGLPREELSYLSLVLFNLTLSRKPLNNYQWIYFGSEEVPFTRLSCPVAFNPLLAPPGKSGLCAEMTCLPGDDIWRNPEGRIASIISALVANGVMQSTKDVEGVHVERIPDAYPVYDLNYRSTLNRAMDRISGFKNISVLGRTGEFWYNNMDHSIASAMRLAERLCTG